MNSNSSHPDPDVTAAQVAAPKFNTVDPNTGEVIVQAVSPDEYHSSLVTTTGANTSVSHSSDQTRTLSREVPPSFPTAAHNSAVHGSNAHDAPKSEHPEVKAINADIAQTRDEMSQTLEAIGQKLDPQHLKERTIETVREATVTRAKTAIETVQNVAGPAIESAQTALYNYRHRDDEPSDLTEAGETPTLQSRDLKPINEQVVVIIGASSGIGRETALEFARRGAKVIVAARGEKGLDSLLIDINHVGGQGIAVTADVTDFAQMQAVAEQAVGQYGRIDSWVHCAAVSLYAPFEQITPEEFKQVIDVNLIGAVHGAMAALPHLRRNGKGALIVISSVEGQVSLPLQSAYASSKHGIIGFLDALRQELAHDNVPISVTNVMPSGINTPFFDKARTKMGVKPMPMPPIYQPSVVAEVILHAAQHPTRDIVAGGGGRMLIAMQKFAPALVDKMMAKNAYQGQMTASPQPEGAPDNLYQTMDGPDHIGGNFSTTAKSNSRNNWLETNPVANLALKSLAVAAVAHLVFKKR